MRELDTESLTDFNKFIIGITKYRDSSYKRDLPPADIVWQEGSTKLLDYQKFCKSTFTTTILFVPSLINKHYILDLSEDKSLVRELAKNNIRVLMVDWGDPSSDEKHFVSINYAERLQRIFASINTEFIIAGYCFGGIIALKALETTYYSKIVKLFLFAVPWDFSKIDFQVPINATAIEEITEIVPGFLINYYFTITNFERIYKKFIKFADQIEDTPEYYNFIAVENWLRDNVDMSKSLLLEFNEGYIKSNKLMNSDFIDLTRINLPTILINPANDYLVPPSASLPLIQKLKPHKIITPHSGHIGMIVGKNAKVEMWEPFIEAILE